MRIVIIGSGNMAHFFVPRLLKGGHEIVQVFSPTRGHATLLAHAHGIGNVTDDPEAITKEADVYILAVKDSALPELNKRFSFAGKLVIHCAGAVPLDAIAAISEERAVIWALYSIRKNHLPATDTVPLVVEATSKNALAGAMELANAISGRVLQADFRQRQLLHLNAVFVNNFTNHLLHIAQQLSEAHQLPFDVLYPIIEQTFSRVRTTLPAQSQTGPAIRKDEATMEKHLALLAGHPAWQQIYKDISLSIGLEAGG